MVVNFLADLSYADLIGFVENFDGEYKDAYGKYTFDGSKWIYEELDTEFKIVVDNVSFQLVMTGEKQVSASNSFIIPASTVFTIKNGDKVLLMQSLDFAKINLEKLEYVAKITTERSGLVRVANTELNDKKTDSIKRALVFKADNSECNLGSAD